MIRGFTDTTDDDYGDDARQTAVSGRLSSQQESSWQGSASKTSLFKGDVFLNQVSCIVPRFWVLMLQFRLLEQFRKISPLAAMLAGYTEMVFTDKANNNNNNNNSFYTRISQSLNAFTR